MTDHRDAMPILKRLLEQQERVGLNVITALFVLIEDGDTQALSLLKRIISGDRGEEPHRKHVVRELINSLQALEEPPGPESPIHQLLDRVISHDQPGAARLVGATELFRSSVKKWLLKELSGASNDEREADHPRPSPRVRILAADSTGAEGTEVLVELAATADPDDIRSKAASLLLATRPDSSPAAERALVQYLSEPGREGDKKSSLRQEIQIEEGGRPAIAYDLLCRLPSAKRPESESLPTRWRRLALAFGWLHRTGEVAAPVRRIAGLGALAASAVVLLWALTNHPLPPGVMEVLAVVSVASAVLMGVVGVSATRTASRGYFGPESAAYEVGRAFLWSALAGLCTVLAVALTLYKGLGVISVGDFASGALSGSLVVGLSGAAARLGSLLSIGLDWPRASRWLVGCAAGLTTATLTAPLLDLAPLGLKLSRWFVLFPAVVGVSLGFAVADGVARDQRWRWWRGAASSLIVVLAVVCVGRLSTRLEAESWADA